MTVQPYIPLAPLTTLRVGGPARFFTESKTLEELGKAVRYARAGNLSILILGAGSNVLVPDKGVEGLVVKIKMGNVWTSDVLLVAEAGAMLDDVIDEAAKCGLWGVENLAGIPGTIGGAAVQNAGAYGAELSQVFEYADAFDFETEKVIRITREEAEFGYRNSIFKKNKNLIITTIALRLSRSGAPNLSYPDLKSAEENGMSFETPEEIARSVRIIRAEKFPNLAREGSAGSFFKNPVVSASAADKLAQKFVGLPLYPQNDGSVKLPLAWILDRVLSLRGFSKGLVRLYEKQPLVITTKEGATAAEINAFADEVAKKVFDATGIKVEREVEEFAS